MMARSRSYLPQVFRNFQGFKTRDIKEWREDKRIEIWLEKDDAKVQICDHCSEKLGAYKDQHRIKAKHLRVMGWVVEVVFFREKRYCPGCDKVRSEYIEFISRGSPHITVEMAWWLSRLTEITSVLRVSKLEGLDKGLVYAVDKYNLRRLLQGYEIPKITGISVDEVYARGPKQLKEGENRDDLFLTVIVDLKTHKVIWVSQSRRKEALDEFFNILGSKRCEEIEVVATDQHEAYAVSVKEYCPNATVVWDRFHLIQNFNEALNEDRRTELEKIDPEGEMGDLMNNKYRYVFIKRNYKRTEKDKRHIAEVMRLNEKIAKMEMIKEKFHQIFECQTELDARLELAMVYEWCFDAQAWNMFHWIKELREKETFWNYFRYKVSTGISEGINRSIKGLKWQAYGYKDMTYFALKILQKCGYLNSQHIPYYI